MHVAGDLGFSSLVLLLSLVFPVIGFVIRRKWRLSVARQEEIKRLLILASEEAARAELEATVSYVAVSPSKSGYQCAVCYSPTTTRCARCKAVRYCSGKCQIIHWRQGHKEECCPPSTHHINDDSDSCSFKLAKQGQHIIYNDFHGNEPIETSSDGSTLSNSDSTHAVPRTNDDNVKVDFVVDSRRTSFSESSSSFSGFSTSPHGGESSDDVSVSESISSNEAEGSDGKFYLNTASNVLEPGLNKFEETKTVSPKFASLANSVDSLDKFSESSQGIFRCNNGEEEYASARSSTQSSSAIKKRSVTQIGKVSSGFWDRTLEPAVSNNNLGQDDPHISRSRAAGDKMSSDSEPFLHFKFDLSSNRVPSLNVHSSVVKGNVSGDANPSALESDKSVGGATFHETSSCNTLKVKSLKSKNLESSSHMDNESSHISIVSKQSELKSPPSYSSNAHLSLNNGDLSRMIDSNTGGHKSLTRVNKSNAFSSNVVSASYLSKSKDLSGASETHLVSSANGHSFAGVKSGKVDNVEADAMATSPSSINGLKSSMRKVVDQLRGPKFAKYNDKGLFPYHLFVKLYTSNKVELRPCGLINCGNSCYANAVLQCLAFTPPLTAYFLQGLHSKECVNKEWCFICEFETLMLKAKEGKSPLSPIGILSQLQNIGSHLGSGREEDAHEFLRYAIDTMQSVCLKEAGVHALGSLEEETTLVGLTFGGYLRSKIKCMKCHYKSERHERMMDLTVEIEGDIGKLEDALKRFTSTEILDGDNKYKCCRCKSFEKAKKKLTIAEAPNVLTIVLKRFQSGKFGKLNKSIRFPEILDLAPYMSGTSDKSPIYRLYGVVVHLDIMNASFSGHYVCYVKNVQNKWFKIDDSTVTATDLERVLTKGAYMLLYARCSPRAPRLIRNSIVSHELKTKGSPSKISWRNTALNSRSLSNVAPNSTSDNMSTVESFYLKFNRLQKILEEDSSSDNYSFTSSNSDEGSCSTESTRDSISTDELSDYIFGGWNNSWRNTSDSDTSSSSSSSPLYSRHSPETSRMAAADGDWDSADVEVRGGDMFFHSDMSKQCRKLVNSSSCRETDSGNIGRVKPVKSGVSFRRSVSERTD